MTNTATLNASNRDTERDWGRGGLGSAQKKNMVKTWPVSHSLLPGHRDWAMGYNSLAWSWACSQNRCHSVSISLRQYPAVEAR